VLHVWSTDGGSDPLRLPIAVALDRRGAIYVVDASQTRVRVFDHDGQPRATWGTAGGDGQFRFAAPRCIAPGGADPCATEVGGGVAVDGHGRVYVADFGHHRIQVFDRHGRLLAAWGRAGDGPGEFAFPSAIAVDGHGRVFVSDSGNARVQVFDGVGQFLGQWRGPSDAGQPNRPGALACDREGRLFVADARQPRIRQFDRQGRLLAEWEIASPPGAAVPVTGLAMDQQGYLLAGDAAGRIHQLASDGRVVVSWDRDRRGDGRLRAVGGLVVDEAGDVYAADQDAGQLHRFSRLLPVTG
jgi:DNA-binding beta-propeller fold protein YncE